MSGNLTTKEKMVEAVEGQLQAYNTRDIESFCRWFHHEVRVIDILSGDVRSIGMELFHVGYKKLFEGSPKLHCEIKTRTILDQSVIDVEWVTGSVRYPDGLHAAAIYAFRDGLIDRVWFTR